MSTNELDHLWEICVEEPDNVSLLEENSESSAQPDELGAVYSWRYRWIKRALDFFAAVALILLVAIPSVFIAAAIWITSPGPIFYREDRIGRNGRIFRIWKFRSMCSDASQRWHSAHSNEDETTLEWRMVKHHHDPRITPVGRFLRRWSIDELPQLINVLRGEMSLVGPRPIVMSEVDLYGDLFSYYLAVTPGLSGLWQVSGRSNVGYEKRTWLDMQYVESWDLIQDFKILLRTIPAVLGRVGAR